MSRKHYLTWGHSVEIKTSDKGIDFSIDRVDLEMINIGISQSRYLRLNDESVLFVSAVRLPLKDVAGIIEHSENLLDTVKR